jgi:hypothetical protein
MSVFLRRQTPDAREKGRERKGKGTVPLHREDVSFGEKIDENSRFGYKPG